MKRTDILIQAPGIISQVIDDEAVLVSPDEGMVRVLNQVGSRVWELLDGRRSLAAVLEILIAEYQVALAQLEADLLAFCDDLINKGLLRIASGAGA